MVRRILFLFLFPLLAFTQIDLTKQVKNKLPIANGGTASATAADARTALGLGNVDNTADANKNVATAVALAADPADCPAGQYAISIASNGALTCTARSIYTYDTNNSPYRFSCSDGTFTAAAGAYASLPSCVGTLQAYAHGAPVTRPTAALNWTALQSATIADSVGQVVFSGSSAGKEIQGITRAVLTPPYTITLGLSQFTTGETFTGCMVGWTNGTAATSDVHVWWWWTGNETAGSVNTRASYSRFNSLDLDDWASDDVAHHPILLIPSAVWIKLEDNSTNRIVYVSSNGIDWQQVASTTRTTFITPTNYFVGCANGTGSLTKVSLFHLIEDDQ